MQALMIASTVIGAYSAYQQGKASKKAAAETRKARKAEAKVQAAKMVREKKDVVERGQRAKAVALAQAEAAGGETAISTQTSLLPGVQGSITSQQGEQLSFLEGQDVAMGQRNVAAGRAAGHQSRANQWGAYGSMAGTIFSGAQALA